MKKKSQDVKKLTGKYKSRKDLSSHHDKYLSEDYVRAAETLERIRQGKEKVYTLEEVESKLELDAKGLCKHMTEASQDPLFMKDLKDSMNAFESSDAEIGGPTQLSNGSLDN